jgi:hypothetical protein
MCSYVDAQERARLDHRRMKVLRVGRGSVVERDATKRIPPRDTHHLSFDSTVVTPEMQAHAFTRRGILWLCAVYPDLSADRAVVRVEVNMGQVQAIYLSW